MSLSNPAKLLPLIRRGARSARQEAPDVPEFNQVADFIGEALELEDQEALTELETRIREEVPEALPWYLPILRTLAGTVVDAASIHHVILVPILSNRPIEHEVVLGLARHELDGQLEHALDLGHGSLKLLSSVVPLATIEAASALQWRVLAQGDPKDTEPFEHRALGAQGGALVGIWSAAREDKARLSRKLLHATHHTPELEAWRLRTQAILQTRSMDSRFSIYPVLQLQDFFTGFRQFQLRSGLESAFRELPEAQLLRWAWVDEYVVCSLSDRYGRSKEVRTRFPDEPRELAQARIEGFCRRRGVVAIAG